MPFDTNKMLKEMRDRLAARVAAERGSIMARQAIIKASEKAIADWEEEIEGIDLLIRINNRARRK